MKIVVLCGGISTEREVSINSSENVGKALKNRGHQVVLLDVFFGAEEAPDFDRDYDIAAEAEKIRAKSAQITPQLIAEKEFFGEHVLSACKEADIVFMGLHGENGENGKVQTVFDLMKIRYTGSGSLGSAIAMSKSLTKTVLKGEIPMPEGAVVHKNDPDKKPVPVPCVVKPSNGGSSVGVTIVLTDEQYEDALQTAFALDDTVLVEKYIRGREFTQGILDGQPLPPIEIIPKQGFYDFTNKYVAGLTDEICPADIPEEVLAEMSGYTRKAGECLGLSCYYRMDYLMDEEGRLYALEANSLPGMTKTSLVPLEARTIGMSFEDLCEKIIDVSLKQFH